MRRQWPPPSQWSRDGHPRRRRTGEFRAGAILVDAAAGLLALFSLAFRPFACRFRTTMTDGPGVCLSG